MAGTSDPQRYLTEIGRQQAEFTGERLRALEIPWDRLVKSTMTRAQETGKIIAQKLDAAPAVVEHCSLIEEGAPIAPEPPIGHWRPEPSVSREAEEEEESRHKHNTHIILVAKLGREREISQTLSLSLTLTPHCSKPNSILPQSR